MNALFKALSHPVRRQIIAMLREGPLASGDIAAAFDMSWPTVTGHLNALKEAELVSTEKHGQSVRYRLEISAVEEGLGFLLGLKDAAGLGKKTNDEKADHHRRSGPDPFTADADAGRMDSDQGPLHPHSAALRR